MKTKLRTNFLLIFLIMMIIPGYLLSAPDSKKESPKADVTILVKGLACPFCVRGVEKKLRKVSNVVRITSELKTGEIGLILNPKKIDLGELKEAVKKAGFTPGAIKVSSGTKVINSKAKS